MILSDKDPDEIITVTFDFSDVAQSLSSPVVEVTALSGVADADPSAILADDPLVSGITVMQRVSGGQAGTLYQLRCTAIDADGEKYVLTAALPVRTARPM